jgi:hypothetical protein
VLPSTVRAAIVSRSRRRVGVLAPEPRTPAEGREDEVRTKAVNSAAPLPMTQTMTRTPPGPGPVRQLVKSALAPGRAAHDRQRELVRASLIARPGAARPTHRRWA